MNNVLVHGLFLHIFARVEGEQTYEGRESLPQNTVTYGRAARAAATQITRQQGREAMKNEYHHTPGAVHTVELKSKIQPKTPDYELESAVTMLATRTDKEGQKHYRLKLNPNKVYTWKIPSFPRFSYNGQYIESAHTLNIVLEYVKKELGIGSDCIMTRLDFKVDTPKGAHVDLWVKTSALLVQCFIEKHHLAAKDTQRITDNTGAQHKGNTARTNTMEISSYNKGIQDPTEGTAYRLEIRYTPKGGIPAVDNGLAAMIKELESLPTYYDKAMETYSKAIVDRWRTVEESCTKAKRKLTLNQTIADNDEFLFSREQLRRIYEINGAKRPDTLTKKYCDYYEHLFVSKAQLEQFIYIIITEITAYRTK